MTFIIENIHLGINENDIKDNEDVKELKHWEEEISKQVIVMDGKIRKFGEEVSSTLDEKKNINKTIHARDLQSLLLKMIDNRLEKLRDDRVSSMEALYFTYAEQDIDPEVHSRIIQKAKKAMEGSR